LLEISNDALIGVEVYVIQNASAHLQDGKDNAFIINVAVMSKVLGVGCTLTGIIGAHRAAIYLSKSCPPMELSVLSTILPTRIISRHGVQLTLLALQIT
jgi:hypothetical protein